MMNWRPARIRVGDSILYGTLDPVLVIDSEDYSYTDDKTYWYGHMEFFLDNNGSIINLWVDNGKNRGWEETT